MYNIVKCKDLIIIRLPILKLVPRRFGLALVVIGKLKDIASPIGKKPEPNQTFWVRISRLEVLYICTKIKLIL